MKWRAARWWIFRCLPFAIPGLGLALASPFADQDDPVAWGYVFSVVMFFAVGVVSANTLRWHGKSMYMRGRVDALRWAMTPPDDRPVHTPAPEPWHYQPIQIEAEVKTVVKEHADGDAQP